jgi:hypothetical protein
MILRPMEVTRLTPIVDAYVYGVDTEESLLE